MKTLLLTNLSKLVFNRNKLLPLPTLANKELKYFNSLLARVGNYFNNNSNIRIQFKIYSMDEIQKLFQNLAIYIMIEIMS